MIRTIARRAVAGSTAGALGLGLLAVGATPASAAADCTTDCIGTVTRTIEPEKATLAFSTTTSARVKVAISPYGFSGTAQLAATTGTAHSAVASALVQGKSYKYQITATDAQGATWQETGYFTAPVRTISIDWGTVAVTDDSDSTGAGEIGAVGQLERANDTVCHWKGLAPFPGTGNTFRSTDSSSTPLTIDSSANLTCAGVESTVWLGISMIDDDKDGWDDCDTGPSYPWGWFGTGTVYGTTGSTECWDWNYGITALTFPHAPGATGSQSQAVTVNSATGQWTYPPAFTATASALFTIATPASSLPATTTGPVTIPLTLDGSKNLNTGQMPRILATWTAASVPNQSLTSTMVRLRKPGGFWLEAQQTSLATTSHEFVGLEAGATYEVVITGRDSNGNEYARTTATAMAHGAPGAPVGLVATPGEGSVAMSWTPGPSNGSTIAGYRVRYRVVGEPLLTVLAVTPETARTVTGLAGGTPHEFYIEAITTHGDVGATAMVGATPWAPAAPQPDPVAPQPDPVAPQPDPAAQAPATPPAAPQVVVTTGARKKDGRARAVVSGFSPAVASVAVAWCDTRVSGKSCAPTTARKRGNSGPLTVDGTLALKLTSKRTATFNDAPVAASFGRIKARKADWIRVQVLTTWADGRVEASPVQKVRL